MRKRRIQKTLKKLLIFYSISLVLFLLFHFLGIFGESSYISISIAVGLNIVNIFLALFLFEKSIDSSHQKFMVFNLGGMLVRVFFLLILFIVIIKILKIDIYEFILVFFVFYFIQLIIEILHFAKYRELERDNGN